MLKYTKSDMLGRNLIKVLMEAIIDQRTCTALYHSFSKDMQHTMSFNPLKLFEWNGGIYAFIQLHPDLFIRTIAVERIKEFTVTKNRFIYPEDFDAEALLESAFTITFGDPIQVKIWFDSFQANYIKERNWVKDQNIIIKEDGSLILEMRTSGVQDVKRWVFSFRHHAKLLEPANLVKEIEEDLKRQVESYNL